MGVSFEEILGSVGRWLDRVGSELGWRWRARSVSGGLGTGPLGEKFRAAGEWISEKATAAGWWLRVRGLDTDRFQPSGPIATKRMIKWAVAVLILGVAILRIWGSSAPPPAEQLNEQEIAALQALHAPVWTGKGSGAAPTPPAARDSALKSWLLRALGMR